MHPNKTFRKTDREHTLDFARKRGFGILALNGPEGPLAAHIPFTISPDGREIDMHILRSNPVAAALDTPQKALLAVSGPDAYISPDWYGIENQVPTWNYVAVHLRGTLRRLPPEDLPASLEKLSETFETRLAPKPVWKMDKVDADILARMQRTLVPIRMSVSTADSTWKLGQNKPPSATQGAAAGLATSDIGQEIAAMAALLKSPR